MDHLEQEVRRTILLALDEDRASKDITSQACIDPDQIVRADFVLKQNAKIAGLRLLPWLWESIDPKVICQIQATDGEGCATGTTVASIEGPANSILSGERSVLNLLQHVSGIATTTARFVEAVKDFPCDILDTRKTLPGLRAIQKYAVALGGGKNHRFHLEQQVLIKNNHLKLSGLREAILRAHGVGKIEIEVESLSALEEALAKGVQVILLDNMHPAVVAEAVKITQGRAYLEASGGIQLTNVRDYAATGVNGISIGALTHSVTAVDISMRIHR